MEQHHRASLAHGMDGQTRGIKTGEILGHKGHGPPASAVLAGRPECLNIVSLLIISAPMSIDTGYRLADNSRQLRRLFDERVRSLGITGPQARLLLSLERNPNENQAFYAERLEIEPITLTRIVDRLEDAGWVERQADPADRRARILHLTDKSRGIVTRLRAGVEGLFEEMLDGFDGGERVLFAQMLERIAANLVAARHPEAAHG